MSDVPERPGRVRGSTRSVGVLRWPVDHSLSPVIHNAAFVALGLDWVYVPLPVAPAELPAALGGSARSGSPARTSTMPHKTSTAELIDDLSEDARLLLGGQHDRRQARTGSRAANSDAAGFERFLRDDVGFDATGRSALLFGAGEARERVRSRPRDRDSRNLSVAVRESVAGRRPARGARGLGHRRARRRLRRRSRGRGRPDRQRDAARCPRRGLPLRRCTPASSGWTSSTDPGATPFQTAVRDAGGAAFGGLEALAAAQAAISFELWTGRSAPLPVMSAAALGDSPSRVPLPPGATGTA